MSGLRYLGPVLLVSLCLLAIGTFTVVTLFQQQSMIAKVLQENVESRRAATELQECLTDLIALENAQVEAVAVMHDRVRELLAALERTTDQPEERELYMQLQAAFNQYLARWQALPAPGESSHEPMRRTATMELEQSVRQPCAAFIEYNGRRIEDSADHHERVLRRLAWGMAIVGSIGATAGVVLGFGLARSLSRSIGRLKVQIQDAAGKLGPDLPDIVLTREGSFHGLHDEVDRLTQRIEEVIRMLQQREHEVLRAEQLAAVGQLAAGVGHEIRNPLTSIKLLVQVALEENTALPPDDLRVIEGEVRRMERSLQSFLDFARPPRSERRRFQLNELLQDVASLIHGRSERQNVRVDLKSEPIKLTADREQLRQVLVNLALNALDAMPNGGTLRITIGTTGTTIEIEVSDTGTGINPALLPRLFEPFVSGKETGLGLGLAISRRIVEAHGGTLTAVNRTDGGARFRITLPTEGHDADASGS